MQLKMGGQVVSIPDFFIVGAAKAGTTSLYYYLTQHDKIFFPAVKEPAFFAHVGDDKETISAIKRKATRIVDTNEYALLFKNARKDQKIGEATTDYLYLYDETISNMKRVYQDSFGMVRIIILLRNPVDRAWSQYWMSRRESGETLPFEEAISERVRSMRMAKHDRLFYDYLGYGAYAKQVRSYLEAFGKEHVRIFLLEDLVSNSGMVCNEIFEFIGVEKTAVKTTTVYNAGGGALHSYLLHDILLQKQYWAKNILRKILSEKHLRRLKDTVLALNSRKSVMSPDTRRSLSEWYRTDVQELSEIIGRDLRKWLS